MISTVIQAITAYSVTNLDDIVILVLLFSRLDQQFRGVHVVAGQFLGLSALVAASLLGFAGRGAVPQTWLGILGLFPVSLGCSQLLSRVAFMLSAREEVPDPIAEDIATMPGLGLSGMIAVATLTIANGSDNIGVYLPMFTQLNVQQLAFTLVVFAVLTAVWCAIAWALTRAPVLAALLKHFGHFLLPPVLLVIGGLIFVDSHVFQHPPQALIVLGCLAVMVLSLLSQIQRVASNRPIAG